MTRETRETGLEGWQEKVGTWRLRADRGIDTGQCVMRIEKLLAADQYAQPIDTGAVLVELLTIARLQHDDLAHGLKQTYARLQREYEAGHG